MIVGVDGRMGITRVGLYRLIIPLNYFLNSTNYFSSAEQKCAGMGGTLPEVDTVSRLEVSDRACTLEDRQAD